MISSAISDIDSVRLMAWPRAAAASQRATILSLERQITSVNCSTALRWNAGCIMRRWRRQRSASLVMIPSPSSSFTRSMPTPLV